MEHFLPGARVHNLTEVPTSCSSRTTKHCMVYAYSGADLFRNFPGRILSSFFMKVSSTFVKYFRCLDCYCSGSASDATSSNGWTRSTHWWRFRPYLSSKGKSWFHLWRRSDDRLGKRIPTQQQPICYDHRLLESCSSVQYVSNQARNGVDSRTRCARHFLNVNKQGGISNSATPTEAYSEQLEAFKI